MIGQPLLPSRLHHLRVRPSIGLILLQAAGGIGDKAVDRRGIHLHILHDLLIETGIVLVGKGLCTVLPGGGRQHDQLHAQSRRQ